MIRALQHLMGYSYIETESFGLLCHLTRRFILHNLSPRMMIHLHVSTMCTPCMQTILKVKQTKLYHSHIV